MTPGVKISIDKGIRSLFRFDDYKDYKIGEILVELSEIDTDTLKQIIQNIPFKKKKPTGSEISEAGGWLYEQLRNTESMTGTQATFLHSGIVRELLLYHDSPDKYGEMLRGEHPKFFSPENNRIVDISSLLRAVFFIICVEVAFSKNMIEALSSIDDEKNTEYFQDLFGNYAHKLQRIGFSISPEKGKLVPTYSFEILISFFIFEISHMLIEEQTIKKCANCGGFFIPTKRTDEIYCNRKSPKDPELTCKEYGSRKLWYDKIKDDAVAKLSRSISSSKAMRAKRNPDIPEYKEMSEYFKSECKKWLSDVKAGKKTKEEYRLWLEKMKKKSVL